MHLFVVVVLLSCFIKATLVYAVQAYLGDIVDSVPDLPQ